MFKKLIDLFRKPRAGSKEPQSFLRKGAEVKIRRSSGAMESGWVIESIQGIDGNAVVNVQKIVIGRAVEGKAVLVKQLEERNPQ